MKVADARAASATAKATQLSPSSLETNIAAANTALKAAGITTTNVNEPSASNMNVGSPTYSLTPEVAKALAMYIIIIIVVACLLCIVLPIVIFCCCCGGAVMVQ